MLKITKETWAQWGWQKWDIPLRSEIFPLFQLMPKGVKCGRGNFGGNKPRTPGTLLLLSYAWAPFWEEEGAGRCAMVEKLACLEGCAQDTGGCHSVLCPWITSRVSSLREDLQQVGPQHRRLNDSLEHQLMLKNILSPTWPPSSAFAIPAEPVNPYKCTMKRDILPSHVAVSFNICWVFLGLFCFGVGVGVDVTSQS